ncbi:MAG: phosphoribosyl-AMP cyclohydrolase [Candidatus Lokiarchaeota archaeon]|nr:phosphoribosyl-AMP cyclohydrolase [Candidatus Lokiarchaeota archaeon]
MKNIWCIFLEGIISFSKEEIKKFMKEFDFSKNNGLISIVAQDYKTNEVLMVAFANEDAVKETLVSGIVTYWSRSRNKLWKKGESSGHVQKLRQAFLDCDGDCLLVKVEQVKAACHTGYFSCFYRELAKSGFQIIGKKIFDPEKVY